LLILFDQQAQNRKTSLGALESILIRKSLTSLQGNVKPGPPTRWVRLGALYLRWKVWALARVTLGLAENTSVEAPFENAIILSSVVASLFWISN